MANHQIPRTAQRIERLFGVDLDGNVIVCAVYRHTRAGHTHPMFYVVQYREVNRRIDRPTRTTREFSGPRAVHRLQTEMADTRRQLERSRALAAGLLGVGLTPRGGRHVEDIPRAGAGRG